MDSEHVQLYWTHALQGARWLLAQQQADGSFSSIEEGVDAYYKIPYALTVTGYPRQAHQLIDWTIKAGALTPEGDLRGAAVKARSAWHNECYTYSNSWMVIGAQRLGRFDYSRRAIAFIRRFISSANGGVFSEPAFAWAGRGRQDMVVSSQAGSACLYMGLWDEAMRIGDWFVEMLRQQPDPQHVLYACSDPAAGLLKDYPANYPLMYVVKTTEKGQWYFYPGIAMGFLSRLYMATGKKEYLDSSEGYFDFTRLCCEDAYCSGPSGKVGWGSAQMYWITGGEKYRKAAVEVGDYLLRTQGKDGSWDLGGPYGSDRSTVLDITAEFVVWLAEIAQHLGRR